MELAHDRLIKGDREREVDLQGTITIFMSGHEGRHAIAFTNDDIHEFAKLREGLISHAWSEFQSWPENVRYLDSAQRCSPIQNFSVRLNDAGSEVFNPDRITRITRRAERFLLNLWRENAHHCLDQPGQTLELAAHEIGCLADGGENLRVDVGRDFMITPFHLKIFFAIQKHSGKEQVLPTAGTTGEQRSLLLRRPGNPVRRPRLGLA